MTGRVYVPSAIEEGGAVVAMGCFSTQDTAMNVLRSFLKKLVSRIGHPSARLWFLNHVRIHRGKLLRWSMFESGTAE